MIATLRDVLICRVELVMPAIMPEYAGATRPVIMRIKVGRASPWPKPIKKRLTASGSAAGLAVVGVCVTSAASSTSPSTSSPMPTGLT